MATENAIFKVGNVVSPVTGSVSTSTLADLDPALNALLDFYPAVIREHLGSRWDAEVVRLGLNELSGNIVAQSLPYDSLPLATENAWSFPLFSIYPRSSTYDPKTLAWYTIKRVFDAIYILPPLGAEQLERLHPFLTQVERVIVDRSFDGFDDSYQSGTNIWAACGIDSIRLINGFYGKIPGLKNGLNSDIWFPCVVVTLEVTERRNPYVGNFEPFAGVLSGSIDIASGSGDGGVEDGALTDFVTFDADV